MRMPQTRSEWAKLAAVVVVAIVAFLVVRRLLPEIDVQGLLEDFSNTVGAWTYPIVGLLAFLETGAFVGLIAPGETFVVIAGAVAGQGATSVVITLAIVWASAFLGDTVSYLLGHKLGRGFVLEHGPRFRITRERFAQVESYFDRHGGKTILIGRFIGIVRALAPFVAGSSGMRYGAMAPYSILGTGLWAATFTLLGYWASQNVEVVIDAAERGLFAFGVLVAVIVAVILAVRYLRVEENRRRLVAAMERRPVLRQLVAFGRRFAPQGRFLANRVTPGGLGLEFTAPLAALAVAAYVLVGYALLIDEDPGPTTGDNAATRIAEGLRADWLTPIVEAVSFLGSGPVFVAVAVIATLLLAFRRHWVEAATVAAGGAIVLIVGPELKDVLARPRPPEPLVGADDYAYPSGHAAHAVIYGWLAITIAIRLRPGISNGTAIIVAGLLLTVLVGLSRVYLGVHYLSDVSGGWALGVCAFSLIAALAVAVSHFRQNAARGP